MFLFYINLNTIISMRSALIIVKAYSLTDIEFTNYFIRFLEVANFSTDVFINKVNKEINTVEQREKIQNSKYNIIIYINKALLSTHNTSIPVIRFVNGDRLNPNSLPENKYEMVAYFGKRNDALLNLKYFNIAYNFLDNYEDTSLDLIYDLFFIIFDDQLFNLIGYINSQFDKRIAVYCYNKRISKGVFNFNVTVISDIEFDKTLDLSKKIIGEGPLIVKALLKKKGVIVVGTRGYGGIVSQSNVIKHLDNGFNGRFGGVYKEMIPLKLLDEDQKILSNTDDTELYKIKILLMKQLITEYDGLKRIINFFSDFLIESIESISLVVNYDYSYLFSSSLNQYIVVYKPTNTFLYNISDEEYKLIKYFDFPNTIREVIEQLKTVPPLERMVVNKVVKFIKHKLIKYEVLDLRLNN